MNYQKFCSLLMVRPLIVCLFLTAGHYAPPVSADIGAGRHLDEARELYSDCLVLRATQEMLENADGAYNRRSVIEKCSFAEQKYYEAMYDVSYEVERDSEKSADIATSAVRQLSDMAFEHIEKASSEGGQ